MTDQSKPVYGHYQPPAKIFQDKDQFNPVERAGTEGPIPILIRIDYDQPEGIFAYFKGMKYPKEGIVSPEITAQVNEAKKKLMAYVLMFSNKNIWAPAAGFAFLLTWRQKISLVTTFLDGLNNSMRQNLYAVYLEPNKYMRLTRELMKFITSFLIRLGFNKNTAEATALNFCTPVEYDDQYHLRIYDLFTAITKLMMAKDPRGTIKFMAKLATERGQNIGYKFEAIARLMSCALLIPKIKRAFLGAWEEVNFANLQADEAVAYFTLYRTDYNYGGTTFEERWAIWQKIHTDQKGEIHLPPAVKFSIQN